MYPRGRAFALQFELVTQPQADEGIVVMQLDAKFIEPFLGGTIEALKVTCSIDVKPGKPFLKGLQPQPDFHVGAVLGVMSSTFSGSLSLLFPEKVFKEVVSSWIGETVTEITRDHIDGVAELLNIIYGSAKVVWNEQGGKILKAIPTVLSGNPLKTESKLPVLVIPFVTTVGEFHVEVCHQSV